MIEYKTYGMARFKIEEGFYTIEQLEQIVHQLKQAKQIQDAHLMKSMQPTEKKSV